jgi:hypothetical protein
MPTLTANPKGSSALVSRSSVPPLAPLEYLQNQQRGSITDPSLHVAARINKASSSNSNTPREDVVTEPKTRKHSAKGSRRNRGKMTSLVTSDFDELVGSRVQRAG